MARHPARQLRAQTHARHLRLASGNRDRNMELLDGPLGIGDVDDHRAIELDRAAGLQRVRLAAAMRTGERDRSPIRIHDYVRLVGRAPLQVDVSHPSHVVLLAALADGQRTASAERQSCQGSRG